MSSKSDKRSRRSSYSRSGDYASDKPRQLTEKEQPSVSWSDHQNDNAYVVLEKFKVAAVSLISQSSQETKENVAVTFENMCCVVRGMENSTGLDSRSVVCMLETIYEWIAHDPNKQICLPYPIGSSTSVKIYPQGAVVDTRAKPGLLQDINGERRQLKKDLDDDTISNVSSSVTGSTPVVPRRPARDYGSYMSVPRALYPQRSTAPQSGGQFDNEDAHSQYVQSPQYMGTIDENAKNWSFVQAPAPLQPVRVHANQPPVSYAGERAGMPIRQAPAQLHTIPPQQGQVHTGPAMERHEEQMRPVAVSDSGRDESVHRRAMRRKVPKVGTVSREAARRMSSDQGVFLLNDD